MQNGEQDAGSIFLSTITETYLGERNVILNTIAFKMTSVDYGPDTIVY